MSTGPFISLLATYTIMFGMHIAMALCSLVSLPFLSVSVIFISMCIIYANVSYLATHKFRDDAGFHKFCHQLLPSLLAKILESLKPGMTIPEVVSPHFSKVIYGLSPYIAYYSEQVLPACIVQGWCLKYGHGIAADCMHH